MKTFILRHALTVFVTVQSDDGVPSFFGLHPIMNFKCGRGGKFACSHGGVSLQHAPVAVASVQPARPRGGKALAAGRAYAGQQVSASSVGSCCCRSALAGTIKGGLSVLDTLYFIHDSLTVDSVSLLQNSLTADTDFRLDIHLTVDSAFKLAIHLTVDSD